MVSRAELIRRIRRQAKAVGLTFEFERQGKEHEIWRCGRLRVAVPRHRDIVPFTAQGICRDLETELGQGWWRSSTSLERR